MNSKNTSRFQATAGWAASLILVMVLAPAARGASSSEKGTKVPVEVFELDNGMRFLTIHRPELASVYAGWVAKVGSANERPGITGISHFFEHMMFKGTRTIGTQDLDRDLAIIEEQESLQEQIRAEYRKLREQARLGEIQDPFDDSNRTPSLVTLEQEFQKLVEEQRALMVKGEFDKIYTKAGASSMNAFTSQDLTAYVISLPANKLELWFWMESDRLSAPVLREFYSERDVVYEERRLRTESTPTGEFDELLEAMFWQSHPYSWPVVGWPSDLESYSKAQADDYFATYYAPNNLTAVLVGNFDPKKVRELAQRYLGRLKRSTREPPDVVTLEVAQKAEKRMIARCDCQPQIEIRYHTVPFRHRDSYALDILSELLNGTTGRLYKSLVLNQEVASRAFSYQDSKKWAGSFSFQAESRGEATPEDLEQAFYDELKKIQQEPIPERELKKIKNRITADTFRNLQRPFSLLFQLLVYEGLGDWRYINDWAENALAVTAEDVQRVARQYFQPENRAVGLYYRKEGSPTREVAPELEGLPEAVRRGVETQIRQIHKLTDTAALESLLNQVSAQKSQVPPEMRGVTSLMEREIQQRLEELRITESKAVGDES